MVSRKLCVSEVVKGLSEKGHYRQPHFLQMSVVGDCG